MTISTRRMIDDAIESVTGNALRPGRGPPASHPDGGSSATMSGGIMLAEGVSIGELESSVGRT